MKNIVIPIPHLKPAALGLVFGAVLGAASAQNLFDVGGAGAVGDTTLTVSGGNLTLPTTGDTWRADGGNGNTFSSLVSPSMTVVNDGLVTVQFEHRYNFETDYDGGALFVSVNGGNFTYVPVEDFTSNGYVGVTQNSVWSGEQVFHGISTDWATPAYVTSSATLTTLGSLTAGDTLQIEFRGGWDTNTFPAAPNWDIATVTVSDPGDTLLDADFAAAGESGFTASTSGTGSSPWHYDIRTYKFELDADAGTADRIQPDAPAVIDLNGVFLEVEVLNGALEIGDTFSLFDLSGGSTLTGNFGHISLPPGAWDTSHLTVDGTITLTLLPPLYTPGADFEVNALLDTDGDNIWEDTVGTSNAEFYLDTANGVSRVATTTATRLPFAYDFPGGFSGDAAPNDDEAGYGGGKLVYVGETGECRSFNEIGWHANDATLEFWLKPDNLNPTPTNGQVIFEDGGGSGFGLFLANNQIYTQQDNGNAGDGQIYYNLSTDPSGLLIAPATTEFIHVVLTRIGSTGAVEMFINGTSVGTATANNGGGWSGGDGFGLGARGEANVGGQGGGDDGTESFDGQIALFRIYNNQILTPVEVANNFADIYGTEDPFMAATLTAPFDGENIVSGSSVVASATMTDPGTTPYTVEFWVDGSLSGTATTEHPYTLDLGVLPDGPHEVYVKFIDSSSPTPLVAVTATHTFTLAPPTDTTITLASSAYPSTYGSDTVTATVLADDMTSLTGGTVQFYDGGSPLGAPVAVDTGTGEASYSLALLGVGTHDITAAYSGWGVHAASSTAGPLSQVVDVATLTVTATDIFRPLGTDNLVPLPHKITGYQNGETLASSGVTGEPALTTAADSSSPVGTYDIICSIGTLAATNYSFTLVDGTLTVADVPDTFSVNFFVGPDWPYGGLTTDEQKENVKVHPWMAAGYDDWLTNGWLNYLVPWNPTSARPPVTLTSNRGSTANFIFKDCRNGWTYSGTGRTTLVDEGNGNMMDAHVNSTLQVDDPNNPYRFDMEVTDIPFAVYDVIFYIGANAAQYGDGTGVIVFNGGPERAFKIKSGAFDGTFTEMVDATTPGNYIVFEGVTGSSFTTQTWGTGPTGFNHVGPFGFQIRPAGTDYTLWAEGYPGADLADPAADFDGDGVSNDDERLFGLDPTDPTSLNPITVPFDPAAGTLSFTRRDNAATGKFSRVETSPDLMVWTEDLDAELIAGAPDGDLVETVAVQLGSGQPAGPRLFVRVVQDDGILFSTDLEAGQAGFTVVDNSGGLGSAWALGLPNSEGLGGAVTAGAGGSTGCWGTDLGPALPAAPGGAYNNDTDTSLVSPVIDLTSVPNAVLSFAEAIDIAAGDSLVVNLIEADISGGINVIGSPLHTSTPDPDDSKSDWATVSDVAITGGQPVRIEWRFTGGNSDGTYIGAYIDDVVIKKALP